MTSDPLPWDKTPAPGWRDAVNGWPWQSLGDGDWEKSGNCPRCGHGISVAQQGSYTTVAISEDALLGIMVATERGALRTRSDEKEQFFARCDCGEQHPGRPTGISTGCGQWAEIDPPPDS